MPIPLNQMAPDADVLIIEFSQREELAASHADLSVTIQGASFVAGDQALRKAREVAQLVQALAEAGVPEGDVHLEGVKADVSSGALLKNSQATYRLRVRCATLDRVADALGAVTSQKNATLGALTWGYADSEALRERLVEECARRARAKAQRVAAALGVRVAGVHRFLEQVADDEERWLAQAVHAEAPSAMRRARVTPEELGLDVTHTKRIEVRVTVAFRVSGYSDGGAGEASPDLGTV